MLVALGARLRNPLVPGARTAVGSAADAASISHNRLQSSSLDIQLASDGSIKRLVNKVARETYVISQDSFVITTSRGNFTNHGAKPEAIDTDDGIVTYRFRHGDDYVVLLRYRLDRNGEFVERWIEITDLRVPLDLLKIEILCRFSDRLPDEAIKYDTFWNSPTTAFLRWPRGGLFTGIENPFFRTQAKAGTLSLSYEPSLILSPGDGYDSDPHSLGVYAHSGRMIADHYLPAPGLNRPLPRFRNPSGHIPLDWNEIQAMRRFVQAYLAPRLERFTFALYMSGIRSSSSGRPRAKPFHATLLLSENISSSSTISLSWAEI